MDKEKDYDMGVELQGLFRGEVIKYNVEKGFGFIRVIDKVIKEDAFIHFSEIEPGIDAFKKLLPGDMVSFKLKRGPRGLMASDLSLDSAVEVPSATD